MRFVLRMAVSICNRRGPLQGRLGLFDQGMIQRAGQAVILHFAVIAGGGGSRFGPVEQPAEVQSLRLPMVDGAAHVELVGAADQLVDRAKAQLGHDLPYFLGQEGHVINDMFRLAGEALPQRRVLGGDADRTGVEVAFAHHQAAFGDQRHRAEGEGVGPQQGGDDHVATGAEAAVRFDRDPAPQPVGHQGLMGFGQAQFPGGAGVVDRA